MGRVVLLLLGPCIGLLGCMALHRGSPSISRVASVTHVPTAGKIPDFECPVGTKQHFHLKDPPSDTPLTDIDLPSPASGSLYPFPAKESMTVRLDVCYTLTDGVEHLELVRAVTAGFMTGAYGIITRSEGAKVDGLDLAVFEEDYNQLNIELPVNEVLVPPSDVPKPSAKVLVIKGAGSGPAAFAAAVDADRVQDKLVATFRGTLVGRLTAGNPIVAGGCPPGRYPEDSQFTVGTAHFEARLCIGVGTSGTTSYSIARLSLTDDREDLGDARGKKFDMIKEEAGDAIRHHVFHHNVCDWLVVTLPHGIYGVTADRTGFGGGLCEPPDPQAPEAAALGVEYRFAYTNGQAVQGNKGEACRHHWLSCFEPVDGRFKMIVSTNGTFSTCFKKIKKSISEAVLISEDKESQEITLTVPEDKVKALRAVGCVGFARYAKKAE